MLKIFILIALVKFLIVSRSVATCAVIYGIAAFLFTLIFNNNLTQAVISGIVGGALSYVYFWLLHKTEGGFAWWFILILGAFIGLV